MNTKSNSTYDAPEAYVINITFEYKLLQGSDTNPGGNEDIDDPIYD